MPLKNLDTYQKNAASSGGFEVAVSAGAGSGKTRLLVARYLHLIRSGAVKIPEIVAITFTEKAAGQMKAGIAKAARELASSGDGDSAIWHSVAAGIYNAPISTIHSFCNSILRRYPEKAGIDPLFTIADDATISELMYEALDMHIGERLDTAQEEMDLLLRSLGLSGCRRILHSMLRRRTELVTFIDSFDSDSAENIEQKYRDYFGTLLTEYCDMIRGFHTLAPGDDNLGAGIGDLVGSLTRITSVTDGENADIGSLELIIENIGRITSKGSKTKWEASGVSLDNVKHGLKEFRSFLEALVSFFRNEAGITARIAVLLLREYSLVEQRFLEQKKKRSCLDHDDSLIETWRLLRKNPTVCNELSQSYKHILVDEFQDTDALQIDILRMIAGNSAATLFTVGDPKQSIYRFRGADVAVFNDFVAGTNVEFKTLRINYRSAPGIIDFVNHVFGRIMGREDKIDRFEAQYIDMKSYRTKEDTPGKVELAVFENMSADEIRRNEADFIAGRMERFHSRDGYSYGDMAIIFRKGTKTGPYEETLLAHGIPYVNLTVGDMTSYPEVHDCANLLNWLCDPTDPVLFTAVLMSPFFDISPSILYDIRTVAGDAGNMPRTVLEPDGFRRLPSYEDDVLEKARDVLVELIDNRDRSTIRGLLERMFELTDYTMTVLADPVRGELALSVLDRICEAADRFEQSGGGITEFAPLLSGGSVFSEITPSVEFHDDAVSLITIHKAKGLEYGVVFLADIVSSPRSTSNPVGLHDTLGPGFSLRDACDNTVKTFVKTLADEEDKKMDIAESKRLFYVGCTRAVDHLVISGGEPQKGLDPFFEKSNWMGWLHSALGMTNEGERTEVTPDELLTYTRIGPREEPDAVPLSGFWSDCLDAEDVSSGDYDVSGIVAKPPPLPPSGAPDHLSPTMILDYIECPAYYRFRHVYSLDTAVHGGKRTGYGEWYGSFAHSVIERLPIERLDNKEKNEDKKRTADADNDFQYHRNELKIRNLVDSLAGDDITESWKEKLTREIAAFGQTPLYGEIAAAETVMREVPFAFMPDDVLVRGAIDLIYRTGDDISIVDFKTDAVTDEEAASIPDRYRLQLGMYAYAVDKAEYVMPLELAIHYLTPGITSRISCTVDLISEVGTIVSGVIRSIADEDFQARKSGRCEICPYEKLCIRTE